MAGSCLLQIAVDGDEATCGRAFSSLVVELALAEFSGHLLHRTARKRLSPGCLLADHGAAF